MISSNNKPSFTRFNATATSTDVLVEAIRRDGGVIVESLITRDAAEQIKQDLKPHFDKDTPDKYGLFPPTTQRATGLLGISDACIELACNPTYISIANALGDHKVTVSGKPIISSTAGFRVTPGSKQQVLHRDDNDYHPHDAQLPVMIGCVTALTKTTKENGATVAIPGSHLWGPERRPLDEEAIPAELEPGDAFIFLGNL
ncbi:hypothetical protein ASPNIDRAFT_126024, partial [Aspergillus niger ATCC 1015]